MPILIVMAGAPASGKSTIADEIADAFGFEIVCPDDIREELFGDASIQRDGDRVFGIAYAQMRSALGAGADVIFDATNCRRKARREVLSQADDLFETAVCAFSSTDLDTCLARNAARNRKVPEDVIERMYSNLMSCLPDTDEGFDYVVDVEDLFDLLEGFATLS